MLAFPCLKQKEKVLKENKRQDGSRFLLHLLTFMVKVLQGRMFSDLSK